MLSALILVGEGKVTLKDLEEALCDPMSSKFYLKFLVPPEPLYLLNVEYSPEAFTKNNYCPRFAK